MADLLSEDEIESRLRRPAVGARGRRDRPRLDVRGLRGAIAFVNRVAEAAEEANHHPDILVHGWNKVRLSLTNHSAGRSHRPPTSRWQRSSTGSAESRSRG